MQNFDELHKIYDANLILKVKVVTTKAKKKEKISQSKANIFKRRGEILSDDLSSILQARRNAVLGEYRNPCTIHIRSVSEATNIMDRNGTELIFLSFTSKSRIKALLHTT